MALQKDVQLKTGITLNYWRVSRYEYDRDFTKTMVMKDGTEVVWQGRCTVTLQGHPDSTSREAGKPPADEKRLILEGARFIEQDSPAEILRALYSGIKEHYSEFEGAVDV